MLRGRVEEYWLHTPFACFPFTSPPVRHRVPSHFNWTLRTQHSLLIQNLIHVIKIAEIKEIHIHAISLHGSNIHKRLRMHVSCPTPRLWDSCTVFTWSGVEDNTRTLHARHSLSYCAFPMMHCSYSLIHVDASRPVGQSTCWRQRLCVAFGKRYHVTDSVGIIVDCTNFLWTVFTHFFVCVLLFMRTTTQRFTVH
jgi:hypothetical protein